MLKSWTRQGQLEMIEDLVRLCDQSERLAMRERASGTPLHPARDLQALADRSRILLAELHGELMNGASPRSTRKDLLTLHRIFARAVARAEDGLHGRMQ